MNSSPHEKASVSAAAAMTINSPSGQATSLYALGEAYGANSVNTTVFRTDPITTTCDQQYAAFYNPAGKVVVCRRRLPDGDWSRHETPFAGRAEDAHNGISIIADSEGYLHLAWDHHADPLRYARSTRPGGLEFERSEMTGVAEELVTYPQFYRMGDGGLLFIYRDGGSGRGNLAMNVLKPGQTAWSKLHANLIDGEGERNAYWQACVEPGGAIHLSWVWRESSRVETNHDICYARSEDGGATWSRSDGSVYTLPITASTAEVAVRVPQGHELINQTSMCVAAADRPLIATYFRAVGEERVQYFVIHHDGTQWHANRVSDRQSTFQLAGGGTKSLPISRPQILAKTRDGLTRIWMLFRDAERGSRVSVAECADLARLNWTITDLTDFSVSGWEPAFDQIRWLRDGVVSLYLQRPAGASDIERLSGKQLAYLLEWVP